MKQIIGRKEKISLPEWGLKLITAKIDTGAYTSAIHSDFAQEETDEMGNKVLTFTVLPKQHKKYNGEIIRTTDYTTKKVKNSFGQAEDRFKIMTKVILFGEEFEAEFTLSDRTNMRNSILLGRKLLKGRFVVDVDLTYQSQNTAKTNPKRL
ncbi:ATP-dependent zinc protease family protein [Lunatibacter salilacus]|uniref:ATP-dependent zinc protease family protein n=1 Tax=Lunatibacter salilacus TaxID=2483804 RepID=UPI00131A92AE|nr:RimK/LysX family protein [Lunatibacter salilacus]